MSIEILEGPDGKLVTAKADEDGNAQVEVVVSDQSGTPLPLVSYDPSQALEAPPTGLGVVIAGQVGEPLNVLTTPAPATLFGAQPTPGTQAPAVHLVEGTIIAEANSGAIRAQGEAANESLDNIEADADATRIAAEGGAADLANIAPGIPDALGQAAAGASMPVVLPAAQSSGELAQQSTLATRASEATAAATLAAVDTLEANTDQIESKLGTLAAQDSSVDQVESKLDTLETNKATATNQATQITRETEIRDRLAQRTTDPLTTAAAQVVRPVSDPCQFVQTTPGSPTYFLQVSTIPARLSSFKMTNTSPGADVYVMVFDLASYTPPNVPDIAKRRILVPLRASQGGTPGSCIYSLTDAEMNAVLDGTSTPMFSSGILIVIASAATSAAPATGATIQMEVFKKAALS